MKEVLIVGKSEVEKRVNQKLTVAKLGTITISPVPASVEIQDSAKIPTPQ